MKYTQEGDSRLIVRWPASADPAVAFRASGLRRRLVEKNPKWLRDAVPGACSLCIVFDPLIVDPAEVQSLVESLGDAPEDPGQAKCVEIPVVYGGPDAPDLARVAEHTGLAPEEVCRRHAAGKYRVAFMGFTPGFAYIVGLPPELVTPRLRSPRPRVVPGSVGVASVHTGIYPSDTAGGWNIIGRTNMRVIDWRRPDPFLYQPGDRVIFKAVDRHEFEIPQAESTIFESPYTIGEIRHAGLLTTVQDLGRGGFGHQGVTISGAMDRIAMRLANLAAGNREGAATLEYTYPAPRIRFSARASFALGGADFGALIAGRPVPMYERVDAKAGEELVFDRRHRGHWGYLALAGGISAKRYLGSAATDTRSGIGKTLSAGARIALETPPPANGRTVPKDLAPMPGEAPIVRFMPGDDSDSANLDGGEIILSVLQDRSGYRSDAPEFPPGASTMLSEGISPGTIQLPPDGKPIFLMADRPTTGGYQKLAFFASIDTRLIAQSPPGTKLRFKKVTSDEARTVIREMRAALTAIEGI
ncbi:MAG: 5-oxoprolinase/urea amidolyase family protein [Planctomycetes bacterium]|nr:5-oxoprolinase/urea amidolyase family protein [Planctomycetota bacterium]